MQRSPAKPDDFELDAFLLYLKEQGFPCGVGERVKAYRLYVEFRPRRGPSRMKTILGPVFARGESDQARFHQAYDLFFSTGPAIEPPPAQPGVEPIALPDDARQPGTRVGSTWWRPALTLVAIAVLVAIGFAARGMVSRWLSARATPPVPQSTPVQVRPGYVQETTIQIMQTPYARPCRGRECLVSGRRPWVLAGVAALPLAMFAILRTPFYRRSRLRARETGRRPPFVWPVISQSPVLRAYQRVLIRTADIMRRPLAGEASELDVPRTVDATIERAGFPTFVLRPCKKAPDYLFLIQQRSRDDHLAHWWTAVGETLQRLGVSIKTFYYADDLRRCSDTSSSGAVSTVWLLDRFPDSHVIVFGRGHDLLQGHGEVPGWMEATLVKRDHRALLTAVASFEWSASEHKVRARLPVVPGRVANLAGVTVRTADEGRWRRREPREMPGPPAPYFDETEEDVHGEAPSLATYLDDDVFQWLCACAVHPKLEWNLTLQIGAAIDPSGRLLEEDKLLQLIRLPFFREGVMPGRWRVWLLKHLAPAHQRTVRSLVLAAMKRNRAPQGTFARDSQDIQIAAQRYWIDPNPRALAGLRAALDDLPDVDIGEDALLQPLRAAVNAGAADRVQLEWARATRSDWRVLAMPLACAACAMFVMVVTPVADTRLVQVTRVQEVAATSAAAKPAVAPPLNADAGPVAPPAPVTPASPRPVNAEPGPDRAGLREGSTGKEVADLQDALRRRGFGVSVTGRFDKDTTYALMRFQRREGLPADGIGDPATLRLLYSAAGAEPPDKGAATEQVAPAKTDQANPPAAGSPYPTLTYQQFAEYVRGLGGFTFEHSSADDPRQTFEGGVGIEIEKQLREFPAGFVVLEGRAGPGEGKSDEERRNLASRRANTVRSNLLKQLMDLTRIGSGWTGAARAALEARLVAAPANPLASCEEKTPRCDQQNQRVDILPGRMAASAK